MPSKLMSYSSSLLGMGSMTHGGYLDRLYVHKDNQGLGVATSIVFKLEEMAKNNGLDEMVTEASITAKPFFEKMGYVVVKEQQKDVRGIILTNYVMKKKVIDRDI